MSQLYNRLIKMAEDRINKVLLWGLYGQQRFTQYLKRYSVYLQETFVLTCKLILKLEEKWFENILLKPELRIYIKQKSGPESYITSCCV